MIASGPGHGDADEQPGSVTFENNQKEIVMSREVIATDAAPAAIGPYSQAVRAGELIFVSGQLPIHPETSAIAEGDIQAQTRQSLQNVQAILEAAGSGLDRVVKATVFLSDMEDFPKMNEIYSGFFGESPPARACVEVARLPRDVMVEIEAIALV